MSRKQFDIAIVILLVISIAISTFSLYHQNTGDNNRSSIPDLMDSVLEITCWDDDSSKICGTGFVTDCGEKCVITNAHLVVTEGIGGEKVFDHIYAKHANTSDEYQLNAISYDKELDLAVLSFLETPISVH